MVRLIMQLQSRKDARIRISRYPRHSNISSSYTRLHACNRGRLRWGQCANREAIIRKG